MNERDLEQALIEWMNDGPEPASGHVLDAVMAHASTHPRRRWWRLASAVLRVVTDRPGDREAPSRPSWMAGMATAGAIALVVMVAVALAPTAPLLVGEPSLEVASRAPAGSLWQEVADRSQEAYVLFHPDATVVTLTAGPGRQIGIGVWEPTGPRSLVTLIAYPDADPERHIRYGFSTYRAEWTLDDALELATVRWTGHVQPGDGSPETDVSGTATYRRVHRESLPPEARYPVPAEPAWEPVIGSMAAGRDEALVLAIVGCSPNDPADLLTLHGDGTSIYAGLTGGQGVGLWAETGKDTIALTQRYGSAVTARHQHWVAQLTGTWQRFGRTGTASAFEDTFTSFPRSLETIAGRLPEAEPGPWPAQGTVWLQSTDQGTVISAYLTDGTVIARDPRYGTGAGFWQPTGGGTLISSVAYPGRALQDHRMIAESTVDPEWSTLSIRYRHSDRLSTEAPEEGTAEAVRLELGS